MEFLLVWQLYGKILIRNVTRCIIPVFVFKCLLCIPKGLNGVWHVRRRKYYSRKREDTKTRHLILLNKLNYYCIWLNKEPSVKLTKAKVIQLDGKIEKKQKAIAEFSVSRYQKSNATESGHWPMRCLFCVCMASYLTTSLLI